MHDHHTSGRGNLTAMHAPNKTSKFSQKSHQFKLDKKKSGMHFSNINFPLNKLLHFRLAGNIPMFHKHLQKTSICIRMYVSSGKTLGSLTIPSILILDNFQGTTPPGQLPPGQFSIDGLFPL